MAKGGNCVYYSNNHKNFEHIIKCKNMRKECYNSYFFNYIALIMFKLLITNSIIKLLIFNVVKEDCSLCSFNITKIYITPVFKTLLNIATNNFIVVLNRKLELVKDLK